MTKDIWRQPLFGRRYRVYKHKSISDIGLPQTILDGANPAEALVLEMGMVFPRNRVLIKITCAWSHILITLISDRIAEQLGSKEGIAKAKLEILSGLQENGTFIYPAHEDLITAGMLKLKNQQTNIVTVGEGSKDFRHVISSCIQTTHLVWHQLKLAVTLPVLGAYNVSNALAIEIARTLDIPLSDIIVSALAELWIDEEPYAMGERPKRVAILNDA